MSINLNLVKYRDVTDGCFIDESLSLIESEFLPLDLYEEMVGLKMFQENTVLETKGSEFKQGSFKITQVDQLEYETLKTFLFYKFNNKVQETMDGNTFLIPITKLSELRILLNLLNIVERKIKEFGNDYNVIIKIG